MEKKARRSGEDTGADPRARKVGHGAGVFPRHEMIGSQQPVLAMQPRSCAPRLRWSVFGSVLAVSVAVAVTVEAEAADAEA